MRECMVLDVCNHTRLLEKMRTHMHTKDQSKSILMYSDSLLELPDEIHSIQPFHNTQDNLTFES